MNSSIKRLTKIKLKFKSIAFVFMLVYLFILLYLNTDDSPFMIDDKDKDIFKFLFDKNIFLTDCEKLQRISKETVDFNSIFEHQPILSFGILNKDLNALLLEVLIYNEVSSLVF